MSKVVEKEKVDEKKIEQLYDLLGRAYRERNIEAQAALRWAIYHLEQLTGNN